MSRLENRSIKIRHLNCNTITDDDDTVEKIYRFGSCLHWINSTMDMHMDDEILSKMIRGCPNLLSLSLFSCQKISDASIFTVAESCAKLKDFNYV